MIYKRLSFICIVVIMAFVMSFFTCTKITSQEFSLLVASSLIPSEYRWGAERIGSDNFVKYLNDNDLTEEEFLVAVIDSGVDANHSLLQGRVKENFDWLYGEYYIGMNDKEGHGTHVAGVIADNTPSNVKIVSVPLAASVGNVVLNNQSSNSELHEAFALYEKVFADTIIDLVDKGVKVINMSLGFRPSFHQLQSGALRQAVTYAKNKGSICVVSAGNWDEDMGKVHESEIAFDGSHSFPAIFDNAITVSATDRINDKASFSSYGFAVDIAAPGENIWSAFSSYMVNHGAYQKSGEWIRMSGTSMSAPFVTAAVANIMMAIPDANIHNVKEFLFKHAVNTSVLGHDENWNKYFGHGIVDLNIALENIEAFREIIKVELTVVEVIKEIEIEKEVEKLIPAEITWKEVIKSPFFFGVCGGLFGVFVVSSLIVRRKRN